MVKIAKRLSCPMPEFDFDTITLGHGSGGHLTHKLLEECIFKLFTNEQIDRQHDGALLNVPGTMAFSTDSFVVSPIFFPGGNIGDLAINGTLNDVAMCGARPKYISLGLIIEEGLLISELWEVLDSIRNIAQMYDVQVVTGDTKVVERGKGDKVFINTTGIGEVLPGAAIGIENIQEGDQIIVSGPIATHGMAIMSVREGLEFQTSLQSDTQYIGDIACDLIEQYGKHIRFMRDPTRGGLATVLNEIVMQLKLSAELQEAAIPVLPAAKSACELLGLDPMYVANEGIFMLVVAREKSEEVVEFLSKTSKCREATVIGKLTSAYPGKVILHSAIGGRRVVPMLIGEQLPRIC